MCHRRQYIRAQRILKCFSKHSIFVFQEVDFSAGPFIISPVRREAADHTTSLYDGNLKIISGLTGLKVNQWGFVLPLTPLVWAATLTALLGMLVILQWLPSCAMDNTVCRGGWTAFSCVRVILQQGEVLRIVPSSPSCIISIK